MCRNKNHVLPSSEKAFLLIFVTQKLFSEKLRLTFLNPHIPGCIYNWGITGANQLKHQAKSYYTYAHMYARACL